MLAAAPTGGGGATGEPTPFDFEVPLGDPGQLEAAARGCSTWAKALSTRASHVRSGAQVACGEWTGLASSQFSAFAAHLVDVYTSLSGTVGEAGDRLTTFATQLDAAQRATRQALEDCERYSGEATTQGQLAQTHGDTVTRLVGQQSTTVTPHASAELGRQISEAKLDQAAAAHAASIAEGELQAAEKRGNRAWTEYQTQAAAAASALEGLGGRIEKAQALPAAARPPLTGGRGVPGGGFWPAFAKAAGSDAVGARIALIGEVADRYRKSDLYAPINDAAAEDIAPYGEALHAGGLLPDEDLQGMMERFEGPDMLQPGASRIVPKGDAEWAMPDWAEGVSRGMLWGGAALTLGSTAYSTWEQDEHDHPGWSTTHKVIDTVQTTVVVGGSTVGGSIAGAVAGGEEGGETGLVIGEAIDPLGGGVVGAAVGGVVGGVVGGLAGGHLGSDIGHAAEHLGHDVGHEVSKIWDAL